MAFVIEDYFEMLALHRALLEAKFSENPNDVDVLGNGVVGSLIIKNIEAMKAVAKAKGENDAVKGWDAWKQKRIGEESREWKICLRLAFETSSWKNLNRLQKNGLIADLFSPYSLNEDALERFFSLIEEHFSNK